MKIYANTGPVTLWVNGVPLAAITPDDHIATWTGVPVTPGTNPVRITAVRDGRPVTDAVTWLGQSG